MQGWQIIQNFENIQFYPDKSGYIRIKPWIFSNIGHFKKCVELLIDKFVFNMMQYNSNAGTINILSKHQLHS